MEKVIEGGLKRLGRVMAEQAIRGAAAREGAAAPFSREPWVQAVWVALKQSGMIKIPAGAARNAGAGGLSCIWISSVLPSSLLI
jgi:hypothetical protein